MTNSVQPQNNWLGALKENPEKYGKVMKLARIVKDEKSPPLVKMLAMAELHDLLVPFINPLAEVHQLHQ